MRAAALLMLALAAGGAAAESGSAALAQRPTLEGVTAAGDKVLLLPNGRWEYVDAAKAAVAKQVAEQYPENKLRPEAAQGGIMGVGRLVMPGDKDYNRGSLNPKTR